MLFKIVLAPISLKQLLFISKVKWVNSSILESVIER